MADDKALVIGSIVRLRTIKDTSNCLYT